MTPQKQTKFSDHNNPSLRGNCFSACLASIMDLDISEIPNFAQLHNDTGEWLDAFFEFIRNYPKFELNGSGHKIEELKNYPGVDGYVIVCGSSPRGFKAGHSVIYKNGEPFFDPHPDNTFLKKFEYFYLIDQVLV